MKRSVLFTMILFASLMANYSHAKTQVEIPEGFELQVLEPSGGKIAKPKGWFYAEKHKSSNSLGWVISKEDTSKKPYETGMRIQFFIGVKEKTGKTPKESALSFIKKKKSEPNVKLLRTCKETDQGDFIHTCIEVETPMNIIGSTKYYRIQYTLFWAKEMDMVVFTVGGTTSDKWEEYRKTFEVMSLFQLVDDGIVNKSIQKQ